MSHAMTQNTPVYLYGFMSAAHDGCTDGWTGPDGHEPIRTLARQGLIAVHALLGTAGFTWRDAPSQRQLAEHHERVLMQLMHKGAVLPVRWGTHFPFMEALEQFLAQNAVTISWFLDDIQDREAWQVSATVDPVRAKAWLALNESQANTEATFDAWMRDTAGKVWAELRRHSEDACPLPLPRMEPNKNRPILKGTLLIPRSELPAWQGELNKLAAEWRERGIEIVASGPCPPYAFCPVLADHMP
jgi:hypothetical protein